MRKSRTDALQLIATLVVAMQDASVLAADGVQFDGGLTYTRIEGVECLARAGDQQAASLLHRIDQTTGSPAWLISLSDGSMYSLSPSGAASKAGSQHWSLTSSLAAEVLEVRELRLGLESARTDCSQSLQFVGRRVDAPDPGRVDRLREATELLDRSAEQFRQSRWADARSDAETALRVRTELLGPEHPGSRSALQQAAIVQVWQGDIIAALPRLEAACPLPSADPASMTNELARCNLGRIEPLLWAGRLREAADLSALLSERKDEEWSVADQVRVRLLRAEALRQNSRLAEGRTLAQEALQRAESTLPSGHEARTRALTTLALAYFTGGNPEAIGVAEQALAAHEAVYGPTHVRTGMALGVVGISYFEYGRIPESLRPSERGYAIVADSVGPDHFHTLRLMLNLAACYLLLGRDEEGLDIYLKVEAGFRRTFGEQHLGRLHALRNIGVSQRRLNMPEDALKTDLELVAAARAAYGPRHESTLSAVRSLGSDYYALGRFREALEINEESIALHELVYGPLHPATLQQRSHHARILRGMKRFDESVAEGEVVLRDVEQNFGRTHQDALGVMGMLADSYEAAGRVADARALNEVFVERFETLRASTVLAPEWRQSYFASVINVYRNLTRYYLGEGRANDAFRISEMTKARTLLETLSLKRAEDSGVLPQEEAKELAAFEKSTAEIDLRIGAARRVEDRVRLEAERNAAAEKVAAYRSGLRERFPRYAQLTEVRIVSAAEGSKLLAADTALVSYSLADSRLAAFVVTRDGMTAHDLGGPEALTGIIEAYRHLINPASPARVWRVGEDYVVAASAPPGAANARVSTDEVANRIARQLFEPIASQLRGKRKWIISPDGQLAVLPFDTLPFDGKPAIEGRSISLVQSVSVLALMRERPRRAAAPGSRDLFAMGAPLYPAKSEAGAGVRGSMSPAALGAVLRRGDPQDVQRAFDLMGQSWPPLPGAESEVSAIRALFRKERTTALLGSDATESNLIERNRTGELARYRYLHFAAHGFLSTDVPALSALVLAQAGNPRGVDGYVTASEWPQYRLDSDLIVLSACQSALGKQIQGEGVMGLPYALFVAGNRQTLLSLWPVGDESTARFMTRFYTRLRAGARPADALAAVKREFRRSPRDAHPLHWAGFVLYGD